MHPNILDIHDEAGAEYDAAFEWYLARSPDSARKFDVEMNRALEQILLAPRRWAVGSHDTRTFLLSRFPFAGCLSRIGKWSNSGYRLRPLQPETRILERQNLTAEDQALALSMSGRVSPPAASSSNCS